MKNKQLFLSTTFAICCAPFAGAAIYGITGNEDWGVGTAILYAGLFGGILFVSYLDGKFE